MAASADAGARRRPRLFCEKSLAISQEN